jgi:hypothetical protein
MKKRLRGRLSLREQEESVNPMDGVANLSDLMIVLAVGIMLALVMNWNMDVGLAELFRTSAGTGSGGGDPLSFGSENLMEVGDFPAQAGDSELARIGDVYFDESTGKYYIIVD